MFAHYDELKIPLLEGKNVSDQNCELVAKTTGIFKLNVDMLSVATSYLTAVDTNRFKHTNRLFSEQISDAGFTPKQMQEKAKLLKKQSLKLSEKTTLLRERIRVLDAEKRHDQINSIKNDRRASKARDDKKLDWDDIQSIENYLNQAKESCNCYCDTKECVACACQGIVTGLVIGFGLALAVSCIFLCADVTWGLPLCDHTGGMPSERVTCDMCMTNLLLFPTSAAVLGGCSAGTASYIEDRRELKTLAEILKTLMLIKKTRTELELVEREQMMVQIQMLELLELPTPPDETKENNLRIA